MLLRRHRTWKTCLTGRSTLPVVKKRLARGDSTGDLEPGGYDTAIAQSVADKDEFCKREMLRFAGPALFIYLANPAMTNIDNAFVGRFSGTTALAALSPGGVLTDNVIFIFSSVLCSATTGLVARAWAHGPEEARAELTKTASVGLVIGVPLTLFYVICSGWALGLLGISPEIHGLASAYARIRGVVVWATLLQGICLSAILATRDAMTPLKVVLLAAGLNVIFDFGLVCWPIRGGVQGAALATSVATLIGCALMLRALRAEGIQPGFQWPSSESVRPILEYAGPMLIISLCRVAGFMAMAFAAASRGMVPLAAYQVIIGIFTVFSFVGFPLSQTAQSLVPALLVDSGDTQGVRRLGNNLLSLSVLLGATITVICFLLFRFGIGAFTTDKAVVAQILRASPSVLLLLIPLMVAYTLDGFLLAAKDFGFIVPLQISILVAQLFMLKWVVRYTQMKKGLGLGLIFATYTLRLACFISVVGWRIASGHGPLGRVVCPAWRS